MNGDVIFKPTHAELAHDKDSFGKMDPYCRIKTNSGEFKTHTANNQGKKPFWNDAFKIKLLGDTTIHLSIWDKDTFSKDDFLAETTINLVGVLQVGKNQAWYPLYRKGKNAGRIYIEIEYIGQQMGNGVRPNNYQFQQPNYMPGQMNPQLFTQQGFIPPQGYPPQVYPSQGFPPQGYPPQGFNQPTGYPPQGYGQQGYPGYYPPGNNNGMNFGHPPH